MSLPLVLRLRADVLARRDAIAILVAQSLRPKASEAARVGHAYAFKNDEHAFARALLAARTQLWLFRSHQQAFCGDFVAVDMSAADPRRRRVWVIDLKRGAQVRVGGGGAGVQFRNARLAVAELAPWAEVDAFTAVTGDGASMLDYLR